MAKKKKTNPWLKHLEAYKSSHPKKSYGECMAEARRTYTKIKK